MVEHPGVFAVKKIERQSQIIIMKTSAIGLLALMVACVLNILINSGCATRSKEGTANFLSLEDLKKAAGPPVDYPQF